MYFFKPMLVCLFGFIFTSVYAIPLSPSSKVEEKAVRSSETSLIRETKTSTSTIETIQKDLTIVEKIRGDVAAAYEKDANKIKSDFEKELENYDVFKSEEFRKLFEQQDELITRVEKEQKKYENDMKTIVLKMKAEFASVLELKQNTPTDPKETVVYKQWHQKWNSELEKIKTFEKVKSDSASQLNKLRRQLNKEIHDSIKELLKKYEFKREELKDRYLQKVNEKAKDAGLDDKWSLIYQNSQKLINPNKEKRTKMSRK